MSFVHGVTQRPDRRLGSVSDPNFTKDGLQLNFQGGFSDAESISDDLVRRTLSQALQNRGLARGEVRVWCRLILVRRLPQPPLV